jgi:hypothetical protein
MALAPVFHAGSRKPPPPSLLTSSLAMVVLFAVADCLPEAPGMLHARLFALSAVAYVAILGALWGAARRPAVPGRAGPQALRVGVVTAVGVSSAALLASTGQVWPDASGRSAPWSVGQTATCAAVHVTASGPNTRTETPDE